MKINIMSNDQKFNIEINEAISKLFKSGKNEFKKSYNYVPNYLAEQILTNKNINSKFINFNFEKWNRSAKYSLLRYCFNKINEENRYLGILELELTNFQYSHLKLSKLKLVDKIGKDIYEKYYNNIINYINNIDLMNVSKNEIDFVKKCLKISSNANIKYYPKYIEFMLMFNFNVNIPIYKLRYIIENNYSDLAYRYISSLSINKKINLFKKLICYNKNIFLDFFNNYNDNSFNKYVMLHNL